MPPRLPLLEERLPALETCGYCPKLCRFACPVSEAKPSDALTPWGKMSLAWLAARGDLEPDRDTAQTAWACTGCFACRERCDHRNEVAHTLGAARAEYRSLGLAPESAVAVVESFGAMRDEASRAVTELRSEVGVSASSSTALLLGCRYARKRPKEAKAAISVAAKLFGDVRLVDGCCGMPLLTAGDRAGFSDQVARVRASVQGASRFVVLDPGCALVLADLGARPLVAAAANELRRFGRVSRLTGDGAVRWHDPCKLGRGLRMYDEPRMLLARALGRAPDEFARRREEAVCSGAGGLVPVTLPNVASRIAETRVEEHRELGGGLIVTGCASSLEHLRRAGAEVEDIVTILDESLRQFDD